MLHAPAYRLAVFVLCILIALPVAAAVPEPLFKHTDEGPVRVMHGDTGEVLSLAGARPPVRAFVARTDALLREAASVETAALADAIADGEDLRQRLDTTLPGTLYLEEAVRRLRQLRLNRVPVASTEVVRTHRPAAPERFAKHLVLRRGADDLRVDYATFAACLERADFPADTGPRTVHVEPDATLWTRVNGRPLAFDIVEVGGERLLVRSVIIGATRSLGLKDKLGVSRYILDNCT